MIKKIYIKEFKKIKDRMFEFGVGMNYLIGVNNSGKTTILELINSALNNDTKIYKEYFKVKMEGWGVDIYDEFDKCARLDFSKASWKWKYDEDFIDKKPGYISAHPTTNDIVKALKIPFINEIESSRTPNDLLELRKGFEDRIGLEDIKTSVIQEKNDDYKVTVKFDYNKLIDIEFDDSIYSISKKGLGQQKEFVINYYAIENTLKYTDVILIDEIENSLSISSLTKIIEKLSSLGKQVIISTHNPQSIKLEGASFTVMSEVPIEFEVVLKKVIYCEGKIDSDVFKAHYPDTTFIPSGGNNIIAIAKSLNKDERLMHAIVDGDEAGKNYEKNIASYPKNIVHSLIKGTVEDYYKDDDKIEALKLNGVNSTLISNDFLHTTITAKTHPDEKIRREKREKIKSFLSQNKVIESATLKAELDQFIK